MGGTLEWYLSPPTAEPVGVEYSAPPAPEPEIEPEGELAALVWQHPTIPNAMRQSVDKVVKRTIFLMIKYLLLTSFAP